MLEAATSHAIHTSTANPNTSLSKIPKHRLHLPHYCMMWDGNMEIESKLFDIRFR
jgi:hypothetical protein